MTTRAFAALLAAGCVSSATAGDLTPPGAPAPTMKTLDEVEPSIPLGPLTTPGDASATYIISQPGSYHLTGNLDGEDGKAGIRILAPDVTLDLRGFLMRGLNDPGGAGTSDSAIVAGNFDGVLVRNGHITGWPLDGVSMGSSERSAVEDLLIADVGNDGVSLGDYGAARRVIVRSAGYEGLDMGGTSLVRDCVVENAPRGIFVNAASRVESCVTRNTSEFGIAGPGMVTIQDSTAWFPGAVGIGTGIIGVIERCTVRGGAGNGITVGNDSAVRDCTVSDVTGSGIIGGSNVRIEGCTIADADGDGVVTGIVGAVVGCNVRTTGGVGINVGESSSVLENTINNTTTDGVRVSNRCLVRGNRVDFCGSSGSFTGYAVSMGFSNTIDGNALTRADILIQSTGSGNIIVNNTLAEPFGGYTQLVGTNAVGPLLTPATLISTPHPQANVTP